MRKRMNPGGEQLLQRLGNGNPGVPFCVFLDAKGKMIVNANRPGVPHNIANIGCPMAPPEIAWFLTMVKRAAPTISATDTATLKDWLYRHGVE